MELAQQNVYEYLLDCVEETSKNCKKLCILTYIALLLSDPNPITAEQAENMKKIIRYGFKGSAGRST